MASELSGMVKTWQVVAAGRLSWNGPYDRMPHGGTNPYRWRRSSISQHSLGEGQAQVSS
ncbi:hypothetical protein HCTV5_138 [Halovirus HCTV-5]|uniref:hypothetical protein n=1 Tax=Halovirus HCTV-5 TaxID=1273748 RepID=UPI0003348B29|nr:hypothetical protein M200_gp090 [Halovirus HCTV-5]AGM11744.1 hypothetical protein HCTV5_138 [Halovirus HCTV-5]